MSAGVLDVDGALLAVVCRRYGIARLEVFGSTARDEATADSGVDLLYELAPGRELGWEIADAEEELAKLFGRAVELVAKRSLHRGIQTQALADARLLYAA